MKLLLVDDDVDLLDVTAYALRREGFSIIEATDGAQALQRWRRERPDLVVLDVGLPGQNGFARSEEHTSELQSRQYLVCRLLLEKKTQNLPPSSTRNTTSS